jgi:hypothetical protein
VFAAVEAGAQGVQVSHAFFLGQTPPLFGAGFFLVLGFPLGVRHAVNHFAGVIEAELDLALVGCGLVPLGQAVAAKPRKVHQVNVLHVLAAVQVGDQAAKGGGFEFKALLVSHGVHRAFRAGQLSGWPPG